MKEIDYWFAKFRSKLKKNHKESMSQYFRNKGMCIGKNCNICSNIMTAEPYLVCIGDGVTIADNVTFVTHDNSISKIKPNATDLFGKITVGNNSFIGSHAILLYGVCLPNNTIVAAGSVVTRSYKEQNIILAGNPAKIIGRWDDFYNKKGFSFSDVSNLSQEEKKEYILHKAILVER